jgi:hypothetical protein
VGKREELRFLNLAGHGVRLAETIRPEPAPRIGALGPDTPRPASYPKIGQFSVGLTNEWTLKWDYDRQGLTASPPIPFAGNFLVTSLNTTNYLTAARTMAAANGVTYADGGAGAALTFSMGFAGETHGEIAYRGATVWQNLATGSAGEVLKSAGPNANPFWGTDTGGAPTNAQYVTLALDSALSNERVLVAGAGLTLTDNGAGATVQLKVKDAGVTAPMLAFSPRRDEFTVTSTPTTDFALSTRIVQATWRSALTVARNGQLLKQVASSPVDASEFTCTDDGVTTTVELGASPALSEEISVIYWA